MKAMTMKKRMLGVIAAGALALSIVAVPAQAASEVPVTAVPYGEQVTPGDPSLIVAVPQKVWIDNAKVDSNAELVLQAKKLNTTTGLYEDITSPEDIATGGGKVIDVKAKSKNSWVLKKNGTDNTKTISYEYVTSEGTADTGADFIDMGKISGNEGTPGMLDGDVNVTALNNLTSEDAGAAFTDTITFQFALADAQSDK